MKDKVMIPVDKNTYIEDYALFLDKHNMYHTDELAAVYYNKRAHILAENEMKTPEDRDRLEPQYLLLMKMSRNCYQQALRLVGDKIQEL